MELSSGEFAADADAWVLLAVLYARAPADRDELVHVGDYINHAIFTPEELDGGLRRLCAAGYVVDAGGRFAPSPAMREWFRARRRARSYVHKDLERVKDFLRAHAA